MNLFYHSNQVLRENPIHKKYFLELQLFLNYAILIEYENTNKGGLANGKRLFNW